MKKNKKKLKKTQKRIKKIQKSLQFKLICDIIFNVIRCYMYYLA